MLTAREAAQLSHGLVKSKGARRHRRSFEQQEAATGFGQDHRDPGCVLAFTTVDDAGGTTAGNGPAYIHGAATGHQYGGSRPLGPVGRPDPCRYAHGVLGGLGDEGSRLPDGRETGAW